MLLKWFERRRASGNEVTEPCRYLRRIRWSGVDVEYVRSTLLRHPTIKLSQHATSFLSRVVKFQQTGVQFDGLRTSHRLATKLERCMLAIVGGASPLAASMCAVSAQLTGSVETRFAGDLPFSGIPLEAAAAVVDSTLYVVGVGADSDQIWAYDPSGGWRRRCGGWRGLVAGRRRHSAVAVDGQFVYSVAGYCPRDRSLVGYVERFDVADNCNVVVDGVGATMPFPVYSAAAAAHNGSIFVFGGTSGGNETTGIVQVYSSSLPIRVQYIEHLATNMVPSARNADAHGSFSRIYQMALISNTWFVGPSFQNGISINLRVWGTKLVIFRKL